MVYFNADGKEASMCGNGGRCCVAFASQLGMIKKKAIFKAYDGFHETLILKKQNNVSETRLKMMDSRIDKQKENVFILNTGSPHYVCFKPDVKTMDVFNEGRKIRTSARFSKAGININFAEIHKDYIFVRTYERGVEDETLSCGTGAVAVALAASIYQNRKQKSSYLISTPGGDLKVHFNQTTALSFENIWLQGPATLVFMGEINV